ncbi:MAG TPA: SIS domain-containing protein, partial [Acidimicrobiales bacterium]|nr:SIS domain-containing protein [Acidimicrobiales bacterium]
MPTLGRQMASEMAEQPGVLAELVGRRAAVQVAVSECYDSSTAGTVVVARGSSDHAATGGRYLLEVATRRPVASASPSIHTLYKAGVDFSDYVVIAVSQSGRTPEIASVLEHAKRTGGRTIAITNDPGSPLAD